MLTRRFFLTEMAARVTMRSKIKAWFKMGIQIFIARRRLP
jgi:hypothetical protein